MLAPSNNPAIFVKEVVEHQLLFQKLIKELVPRVQKSMIKYSRIKLFNSRPKRWGSINYSKLVF